MKVLLIGPLPPPITGNTIVNKVIVDNIKFYYTNTTLSFINTSFGNFLGSTVGKLSIKKIMLNLKQYLQIYKIFNSDIVYITPGQTFWGVLKYAPYIKLAKRFRKKVILHIHGNYLYQEYKRLSRLKKMFFTNIISSANGGIVLSPLLKNNLAPFLSEKNIHILYNFVEDNLFDIDIKEKIKNNFSKLKILFLSNLMKEKGILDLLEALKFLKNREIKFSAILAGHLDPTIKETVYNFLKELDNVNYEGIVLGEKKKKVLYKANVFVFPSYYKIEGQPLSLLEAMATGNIILTTNQGGIPDIFKEGVNGFYIRKKDFLDIAKKLEKVYRNLHYYKKIAFHNYLEAKEKYRVKNFIHGLYNIFESYIEERC